MRVKTLHIIAGSLLAAALCLIPALSRAETIGQLVIDFCRCVVQNSPNAAPNCFGKCVSATHVCIDEKTGQQIVPPSTLCQLKTLQAFDACSQDALLEQCIPGDAG